MISDKFNNYMIKSNLLGFSSKFSINVFVF